LCSPHGLKLQSGNYQKYIEKLTNEVKLKHNTGCTIYGEDNVHLSFNKIIAFLFMLFGFMITVRVFFGLIFLDVFIFLIYREKIKKIMFFRGRS
jgi:hypothetical protein